ncbi:NAD(P)-dependent oxidoreductase [Neobacillus kokaensis]|uniref:3-hydroxyisobutyrate dehydrogenase n=1 Tax=Neobacillus kokaensis TaxID=2759023 RepID=A0ABQ3N7I6_9BACI|nr:NAD(P)-dependent oxidoreductase [Neobacillus kokaensis]GHI00007.1 3-hydroxyisobutyrate dehydrogenase [Neobacillus kokaensis]
MKIGFVGTGVMGSRMAGRLLDHGYQVQVYNRTKEKVRALVEKGAVHAETIALLAESCDMICTCLSMPSDVEEVYLGVSGILDHARPGTVCIDFTTVGADTSRAVFEKAAERGIDYLDAPVSGGPEGAENGSLTIMVGGERAAFEKVAPVLGVLGKTIEYLGKSGSGSIAKLINQYLVAVHSLAASEAMVTGAAFGLDSEKLLNILKVSYGDSAMLRRHMEQYVLDRQFAPGGAVKYVHKDVRLANQLLEQAGLNEFTGQLAEHAFQTAAAKGLNDLDMSAVIQPLEEKCGVVVMKHGTGSSVS